MKDPIRQKMNHFSFRIINLKGEKKIKIGIKQLFDNFIDKPFFL